MPGAEIFGGAPNAQPAVRIEALPDSNRGQPQNVTPLAQPGVSLLVSSAGGPVQGPFIQNAESTDYTLYVAREWFGPQGPAALLRDASLHVQVGAGSGLSREMLVPLISPIGVAYHVAAQTVRTTLNVQAVNPGQLYFAQDNVVSWIARGRPSVNVTQSTQLVGALNAQRMPSFARYVTIGEQTPGMFTPATATVEFLDVDGTVIQQVPLTGIALGQRLPVYLLASSVQLTDVNALARGVLTWECIA